MPISTIGSAGINQAADTLLCTTSGSVGIGTASPAEKLDVSGNIRLTGADTYLKFVNAGGYDFSIRANNGNRLEFYSPEFSANALMSLTNDGNVMIGTTTINTISPRLTILGMTAGNQWSCGPTSGNDSFFIYNQSSVGVYLGYGNTSWSSSSDERIKTAIIPFENALEKVCTLRAGTGRYLTDEETVSRSFLIAQDVQAVLPEAVNVQDDEIGTLGLQYTDVIPLLVAAIKEQQALITGQQAMLASLTARIEALENK